MTPSTSTPECSTSPGDGVTAEVCHFNKHQEKSLECHLNER